MCYDHASEHRPFLSLLHLFLVWLGLERFTMTLSMSSPVVTRKASRYIQISLFIPVYELLQEIPLYLQMRRQMTNFY